MTPTPESVEAVARALMDTIAQHTGLPTSIIDYTDPPMLISKQAAAVIAAYEAARHPQPQLTDPDCTLAESIHAALYGNFAGTMDDYSDMAKVAADVATEHFALAAPVPPVQIPEGWVLRALHGPDVDNNPVDTAGAYFALVYSTKGDFETRHAFGPTWEAALAAAVEQIGDDA